MAAFNAHLGKNPNTWGSSPSFGEDPDDFGVKREPVMKTGSSGRIRTRSEVSDSQGVANQDSQRDSLSHFDTFDPDLKAVIERWPTLSAQIKSAIVAILNCG